MEEVLEDLYNRAQSNGYGKSKEDFTTLIYSNDDVLEDMYGYVQSKGYAKTKEDFENHKKGEILNVSNYNCKKVSC